MVTRRFSRFVSFFVMLLMVIAPLGIFPGTVSAAGQPLTGYLLPIAGGYKVLIDQSNCRGPNDSGDHCDLYGGKYEDFDAYDFQTPSLNHFPVVAAKAGKVIAILKDSVHTYQDQHYTHSNPNLKECASALKNCAPNFVVIQERANPKLTDLYMHFMPGTIEVKPGQSVSQGQYLGVAGQTGYANGIHVHFQVQNQIQPPKNCANETSIKSPCFSSSQWWVSAETTGVTKVDGPHGWAYKTTETVSFNGAAASGPSYSTCDQSWHGELCPGDTYTSHNLAPFTWVSPSWWIDQGVHEDLAFVVRANSLLDVSQWMGHINFTWQSQTSGKWSLACPPVSATTSTVSCFASLGQISAITGKTLTISFDVHDKWWNADLAPDGERTIWITKH